MIGKFPGKSYLIHCHVPEGVRTLISHGETSRATFGIRGVLSRIRGGGWMHWKGNPGSMSQAEQIKYGVPRIPEFN